MPNIDNSLPHAHRRQSDHDLEQIEQKIINLIEQTDSSRDKAYLLILMKINESITNNTRNTNRVSDKLKELSEALDTRARTEDAFMNRSKGWRDVLGWVLGISQAAIIGLIIHFSTEITDIKKEAVADRIVIMQHISSVEPIIDKYFKNVPMSKGQP